MSTTEAQRWAQACRGFVAAVREQEDPEDTVQAVTRFGAQGAKADSALLFLPTLGTAPLCEAAFLPGEGAGPIGSVFTANSEILAALQRGEAAYLSGAELRSQHWAEGLSGAEHAMLLPVSQQGPPGVLVLLRCKPDPFDQELTGAATAFASQAGLVLELAGTASAGAFHQVEEERQRIAADLHDLAIQGLFATGIQLRDLEKKLSAGVAPAVIRNKIDGALTALDDSVQQIRHIVGGLKGTPASVGFVDSLREEASLARSLLGFAPTLVIEVDGHNLGLPSGGHLASSDPLPDTARANSVDAEVAAHVLAVVREALSNVARHARANSASVTVSVFGSGPSGEIVVEVLDDGVGVEPCITRESGIANMARRAEVLSGSFNLGPGPRGRGTAIVWRAPLA